MSDRKTTADEMAAIRAEATALRVHGQTALADAIDRVCDRLASSKPLHEVLNWFPEPAAMMRSGRSKWWFRSQFTAWESRGLARINPRNSRERHYAEVVIPYRASMEAARQEARDAVGAA